MQIDLNMACLKLKDLPANSTHKDIYKKLGVEEKYMTKLREYFVFGSLMFPARWKKCVKSPLQQKCLLLIPVKVT
jgi:hypothetical protein